MKEPIKLAIVGLGRAGRTMHFREMEGKEDMFSIVAVCDVEQDRCQEIHDMCGALMYPNIEELVLDPNVEVVDIATRSCDHFKHAKTALEAGKIVFLEKPICTTYAEAKKLFELGDKDGKRKLFIRHNRRFEAKFMQVNKIIESGILGDVYLIKLARNAYEQRIDWQTLSQYGGGQLLNWGPHIVDHALRFCGGDYKTLSAQTRQIAAAGDCEDFIKAVFCGVNGRIVDMEISGGTALKTPEYVLYGTRGTLVDNGDTYTLNALPEDYILEEVVAEYKTPEGAKFKYAPELPFVSEEKTWDTNPLDHTFTALYEAVRNGVDYPIQSAEALKVMEAIEEIKKQNA